MAAVLTAGALQGDFDLSDVLDTESPEVVQTRGEQANH